MPRVRKLRRQACGVTESLRVARSIQMRRAAGLSKNMSSRTSAEPALLIPLHNHDIPRDTVPADDDSRTILGPRGPADPAAFRQFEYFAVFGRRRIRFNDPDGCGGIGILAHQRESPSVVRPRSHPVWEPGAGI